MTVEPPPPVRGPRPSRAARGEGAFLSSRSSENEEPKEAPESEAGVGDRKRGLESGRAVGRARRQLASARPSFPESSVKSENLCVSDPCEGKSLIKAKLQINHAGKAFVKGNPFPCIPEGLSEASRQRARPAPRGAHWRRSRDPAQPRLDKKEIIIIIIIIMIIIRT